MLPNGDVLVAETNAPPKPEDGTCTLRGSDARRILRDEFGVTLGRQAVYDLLHRLGYSSLMPRPQHEDANPEVQEFFKEIVVEQIEAIAASHPRGRVRVYFQDEARFGTQGTITRVWARKGSRPRTVRQNGREWLYVLMAVCVATGASSALIMPGLDVEVINLFNRVQTNSINVTAGNSAFGQITSQSGFMRVTQVMFRFTF